MRKSINFKNVLCVNEEHKKVNENRASMQLGRAGSGN
jgi:hypothetical protein